MKTEDLVSLLSTGAEAVDRRLVSRRWLLALAGGTLIAFLLTAGLLKLNPALWHETSQPMFWVRESYCAALGVLGFVTVSQIGSPGIAARRGPHGDSGRSDRDVGPCGTDLGGRLAAESSTTDSWAYRRRLPFPDRARRGPAVNSAPLGHAEPCPDAAALGRRRERVHGGIHRCAGLYPALPRAGGAVSRYLVPARYADPHRHRRVAWSAVAALVARLTGNPFRCNLLLRANELTEGRRKSAAEGASPVSWPRDALCTSILLE